MDLQEAELGIVGVAAAATRARKALPPPAEAGRWIKVGGGRWAGFIALTIFASFWNVAVSFGVRDVWSGLSNSPTREELA